MVKLSVAICFLSGLLPTLLGSTIEEQIARIKPDADKIIDTLLNGELKGEAWKRLALFTDTVGNRISGSANLERAVDYMLDALSSDGLANVHGEEAMVPRWERGNEHCTMHSPRHEYHMNILGLGTSIGTPSEGITADVIVVESFEELARRQDEVPGKIVAYNQQCDWTLYPDSCYGDTVNYRTKGATYAAKYGAVAALVRSVAAFSIGSPHTGVQHYDDAIEKIPVASITIEDAEALARMQENGQTISVTLYMEAKNYDDAPSMNVVAEWIGSEYPEEVIIVSGHLDSWDVGVGAMDDGGGAIISWEALRVLQYLDLRPKRTIRLVMWTCEEFGGVGAEQYYNDHVNESAFIDIAFESDIGTFTPLGIDFTGNAEAWAVMEQVVTLLAPIGADQLVSGGSEMDNGWWEESGVPTGSLANAREKYFWYHHSAGDQMNVEGSGTLDECSAVFAVTAYAIASLDEMLPR